MKDFLVIITILLIVFGGNYFVYGYIDDSGRSFLSEVENLKKSIKLDENTKKQYVQRLLNIWEKNEKKWIMIGYHEEINNIEDLLIECYSYYFQDKEEELDIAYKKIIRCLDDLRNREKLTLTNIL